MMLNTSQPTILWLLQDNQVSPIILDFLKLLKQGIGKINVQIIAPARDQKILEMIKPLDPLTFQVTRNKIPTSVENFQRKRDLIHDANFTQGLEAWKVLLLDDLGAGVLTEAQLQLPHLENIFGIILQIPTPLGSATPEEIIFYEWIKIAHEKNVFIAGYELLPLHTRWTMLPAMLDGIITTSQMSYDYLSSQPQDIKGKIWKLPLNESKTFSPGTSALWHNGLEAPYHYRHQHKIPKEKTILFIAHNVATSYEYRKLLEEISCFAQDLHLMFSYGKDQIRGTHSHQQVIETISHNTLDKFHSYSFHDLSKPWEMVMADAVLATSLCYSTTVAEANGIPCVVMDNMVPEAVNGKLNLVNSYEKVRKLLKKVVQSHNTETDFTNIIYQIVNKEHSKISYK